MKHRQAGTSHLAARKTHKRKRMLRGTTTLAEQFTTQIKNVVNQLVAGFGDEAALALDRCLEPGEHLVQRLAEPLELIAGARDRESVTGAVRRDLRRPPPHRLDGAQTRPGEEIPEHGGDQQREWTGDQQLGPQAAKRLGPVLERGAEHEHAVPDRYRKQAGRLV